MRFVKRVPLSSIDHDMSVQKGWTLVSYIRLVFPFHALQASSLLETLANRQRR